MKKVLLLIMILTGCFSGAFAQDIYPLLRNAINKRVNKYSYLREIVEQKDSKLLRREKRELRDGLKTASDFAASADFLYDTQNDTVLIVLFDHESYMLGYEEIYIRSSKSEKSFVKNGLTHKYEINTKEFYDEKKYYIQLLYDGNVRGFRKFYIANENPPIAEESHRVVRIVIHDGKIVQPSYIWNFFDMPFWIIS